MQLAIYVAVDTNQAINDQLEFALELKLIAVFSYVVGYMF